MSELIPPFTYLVLEKVHPGVKRLEHEADQSPTSNENVMNTWRYRSN